MKKSFIFTFVMVCIGAIIGAGFASGKELVSFFGNNGFWAMILIPLTALLFFWCFYLFSKLGKMTNPKSISDMTKNIFGKGHMVVDFCFILCTFITLASMLAGCDSIGTIAFGENYNFCYMSILTAMIVVVLLSFGLKWIYKVNNFVLPTILILIITVIVGFAIFGSKPVVSPEHLNAKPVASIVSCFLYVGMNIFTNIFIIAKSSQYLNKKQVVLASVITSVILCLFVTIILLCVIFAGDKVFLSDMPMVSIAYSLSGFLGVAYSVVLWLAIFTTIILAGYTIQMWLNNFIKNKFLCGVITVSIGFIFSRFGFATIVDIFYPLEGIFALIMIVYCSAYYLKNKNSYYNFVNLQKQSVVNDHISTSLDFEIDNLKDKQYINNKVDNNLEKNNNDTILKTEENNNKTHNQVIYKISENQNQIEQVDSIKVEHKKGKRVVIKKYKSDK